MHEAVSHAVEDMLGGKSVEDLEEVKVEVQDKLEKGGRDVDVDYWSKVLGKEEGREGGREGGREDVFSYPGRLEA
jgi:hypothetical protein